MRNYLFMYLTYGICVVGNSSSVQTDFPLYMQVRHALRKELSKAGVKDPMTLEKSFWIQRVGEVMKLT